MTKHPVLKPKEVATILEKLVLLKHGKKVRISNIAIPMGALRPFRFMEAAIFRQFCCDKSRRILG